MSRCLCATYAMVDSHLPRSPQLPAETGVPVLIAMCLMPWLLHANLINTCKSVNPSFCTSATCSSYGEPALRWMLSGQTREYDVHSLHPILCPKTSDWGLQHKMNADCNICCVQQLQPLKTNQTKKTFAGSI